MLALRRLAAPTRAPLRSLSTSASQRGTSRIWAKDSNAASPDLVEVAPPPAPKEEDMSPILDAAYPCRRERLRLEKAQARQQGGDAWRSDPFGGCSLRTELTHPFSRHVAVSQAPLRRDPRDVAERYVTLCVTY